MDVIGRGIIAGFLATLLLSMAVDPIATLARAADVAPPTFGWALHFLVGSLVWGAIFPLAYPHLRGPAWLRGLLFGFVAWMIVMLAIMPLTRGGLFGLALGFAAPTVMLLVHLVYGTLLGSIYRALEPTPDGDSHAHEDHFHPLVR